MTKTALLLISFIWMASAFLDADENQDIAGYAVSLKDYVRFLDDARLFQSCISKGDYEKARALAEQMVERNPEINSGYEMGVLVGAFSQNIPLIIQNLRAMKGTYFLYPDTYHNLVLTLEKLPDASARKKIQTELDDFFTKREAFLKSKLTYKINTNAIYVELLYLNLASDDPEDVIKYLEKVARIDYSFIQRLSRNPKWRGNSKFRKLKAALDAQWHKWDGSLEQKLEGLLTVATEMRHLSASLAFSTIEDWNAHVAKTIPAVIDVGSKQEYYEALAEMVHKVGENHTSVRFPKDIVDAYSGCGLEIVYASGKYLINNVLVDDTQSQIRVGDEILTVDRLSVRDYIEENKSRYPFVLYSFFQPESYSRFQTAKQLLIGEKKSRVRVEFSRPDQSRYTLSLKRDYTRRHKKKNSPKQPAAPLSMKVLEGSIFCFTLTKFGDGDVYKEFRDALGKIDTSRAKGVIFDVRRNPGGHSGYGDSIFSHFITSPCKNYFFDFLPVWIPHKVAGYHGHIRQYKEGTIIEPAVEYRFQCPVVILTSPDTGSAAEDFVFLFKYYKRGTVVGLPTGGATGLGRHLLLPGGGSLRIAMNVNLYFSWQGIQPDVLVDFTTADLVNGRDPQFEKALEILSK